MTDLISDGMNSLAEQLKESVSQTIQYWRGGSQTGLVKATLGLSRWENVDANGVYIQFRSMDFVFPAVDLTLSDSVIVPQIGDRIKLTRGSTTYLYEVIPITELSGCYRTCGPHNVLLRVFTKEVGTE